MITHAYECQDDDAGSPSPSVPFAQFSEEDPEKIMVDSTINLDRDDWDMLGRPDVITVTITAGDDLG